MNDALMVAMIEAESQGVEVSIRYHLGVKAFRVHGRMETSDRLYTADKFVSVTETISSKLDPFAAATSSVTSAILVMLKPQGA